MVISWAEMLIVEVLRIPKLTVVAVEAIPELTDSVFVQPVVFPLLIAPDTGAIVKVSVGSTVACTCTDSIVPIVAFALSSVIELAS